MASGAILHSSRRRSPIGAVSSDRRSSRRIWGLCCAKTPAVIASGKVRSRRQGTATVVMCWCKRHGAFTTVRRRPSISNGARRGGAAAGGDCARVEGATAISRALHPSRIGKQPRSRWWRWRASSSAFCGQRGKTARRAPNDDSPSNRTNWKTACGLRLEGRALATALCGSRSQQARDPRVWNAVAPTNPLASEASIRSVAVRFNER